MDIFFCAVIKNTHYYKSRHNTNIMTTESLQAIYGYLKEKYTQYHLTVKIKD